MNEKPRDLQSDLERATSRRLPAGDELSKDAAELRDGWLAFGQLLDASDRSFDPRALLAELDLSPHERGAVSSGESSTMATVAAAHSSGSWKRLMMAVVAASLLAAVALAAWQFWRAAGGTPDGAPVAHGDGLRKVESLPPKGSADVPPDLAAGMAWDDSFDEQLAVTQQRILDVRASSTVSEVRFESLRQAVEQFDSDLNSSSL